jgi:MFS family permease
LITFLGVSKTKINYMAHSFFIGQILGSLGLARIPDIFGRKWPIVYALAG